VGIAVFATVITSSFIPILRAFKDNIRASVPLPTATPYFDLFIFKKFFSNFLFSSPKNKVPLFKTLVIELSILYFRNLYSKKIYI